MHGSRATNYAVDRADLLIALGVRFDDRATGSIASFARRRRSSTWTSTKRRSARSGRPDISAGCDVRKSLRRLNRLVGHQERAEWNAEIQKLKAEHSLSAWRRTRRTPAPWCARSRPRSPEGRIVAADVGQHQMWAAQWWPVRRAAGAS